MFRKNYQQNIFKDKKNSIFVGDLVVIVPPKKVVKTKK